MPTGRVDVARPCEQPWATRLAGAVGDSGSERGFTPSLSGHPVGEQPPPTTPRGSRVNLGAEACAGSGPPAAPHGLPLPRLRLRVSRAPAGLGSCSSAESSDSVPPLGPSQAALLSLSLKPRRLPLSLVHPSHLLPRLNPAPLSAAARLLGG